MKKLISVVIMTSVLVWGVGCGPKQELPPGYKLLCSVKGEKYSLWMPDMAKISINVFNTKTGAIRYANDWDDDMSKKPRPTESSKYQWEECGRGDK